MIYDYFDELAIDLNARLPRKKTWTALQKMYKQISRKPGILLYTTEQSISQKSRDRFNMPQQMGDIAYDLHAPLDFEKPKTNNKLAHPLKAISARCVTAS